MCRPGRFPQGSCNIDINFPELFIDSAFEPFAQSSSTLESAKGGVGLGLSICRGLVEAMDGAIAAENADPGARIVICLPRG